MKARLSSCSFLESSCAFDPGFAAGMRLRRMMVGILSNILKGVKSYHFKLYYVKDGRRRKISYEGTGERQECCNGSSSYQDRWYE
jgi:hypothetical protein